MSARGFLVCAKRCDECLFSSAKIVSDARRDDLLKQLDAQGAETHFICHKHSEEGRNVNCRGDYDRDPMRTQAQQVAARLGVVIFVDERGEPVAR